MNYSQFGSKLAHDSGILRLMDDLGRPLPPGVTPRPLGGGNPARIPSVEAVYRRQMEHLLADGDRFENAICRYDAPQGRISFISALAHFFNEQYGWTINEENIAITNGSQSAFFFLFNLFSGLTPKRKTILFPLVPEYVGYADQGIEADTFVTLPASISLEGDHSFKYHIDIPLITRYLQNHPEVGAMCVSRPTNPTGNVLTDTEIEALHELSRTYGIPLMIDNAYGMPFPNIIFPERMEGSPVPVWKEGIILSMSLSKIGLPTLRTGIIIADSHTIKAVSAINSVVSLSSGSLGQVLAEDLIRSGEIKQMADTLVSPYYRNKSAHALSSLNIQMKDIPWRCHRCEGAIFLWLYLPQLSITSHQLYALLKSQGVVVVPGEYFFFGRESGDPEETAWKAHPHRFTCLRLNYSGNSEDVDEGIRIIAETARLYQK